MGGYDGRRDGHDGACEMVYLSRLDIVTRKVPVAAGDARVETLTSYLLR